ncbi:hypothetical protein ABTQ07_22210, partial [Acinetobacter baumannii]
LLLGDGWSGFARYEFDEPETFDSSDAVQRSEYRASYRGRVRMQLTIDAESPRLARIMLRASLDGSELPLPRKGS